MKHMLLKSNRAFVHHILLMACIAALAAAFLVALPQPALAASPITLPDMPPDLRVPDGNEVYLVGHAVGTQNYVCLPSGSGFAFTLFTPQATLYKDAALTKQIITHFFSPNLNPNPLEPKGVGAIRATWQSSQDTSTIWAAVLDPKKDASTDPQFVAKGAVAWLTLTVVGHQDGPDGGDTLSATTFVQRLNTKGGVALATDCDSPDEVGHTAFVPYTADYFFFKASGAAAGSSGAVAEQSQVFLPLMQQ